MNSTVILWGLACCALAAFIDCKIEEAMFWRKIRKDPKLIYQVINRSGGDK